MRDVNYKNEFAQSANEHMYIGMFNETTMEKEGGTLIIDNSEGMEQQATTTKLTNICFP